MWVTTFFPADGGIPEEYYYHTEEEARYHKSLLEGDDLYSEIIIHFEAI